MSAAPQPIRHLRAITDEGEIVPLPNVPELEAQIDKLKGDLKAAEKDLRAKRRKISELERNKARERLEHPDRALIVRVATYWHRKCRAEDPRVNPLSDARFDAVAALLELERIVVDADTGKKRRERVYSAEDFKTAIDGAAFDHYTKQRKNGSLQHFDDLELVCRDSKQFEEFRSRAPKVVVHGP